MKTQGFFIGMLNNNLRGCIIYGLLIDGLWETNPLIIKKHIFDFYKVIFDVETTSRTSFSSKLLKTSSPHEATSLEAPFSVEEIKDAVWSCGGEKSPDLNGFTFKFIKKHWDTIRNDIIN